MSSSRTAITHSQRSALRDYYRTTQPKPTHSALRIWFKSRFGHEISQSIVSRSLSDNFTYLDACGQLRPIVSEIRVRSSQWPWIDSLLSDWLQAIEGQSGTVSNDVIQHKARQIWNYSDESQGLVMPKFSAGWVTKFRRRHRMRHQIPRDRQHVLVALDSLSDKEYSLQSHGGSGQGLENTFIIFSPQSNTASSNIPTNNTGLCSEFSTSTTLTFSSDHLIHLIQHNVFRALISNKSLLRTAATFLKAPYFAVFGNESTTQLCGNPTVIRPLPNQNMPNSLYPTLLQMNCVHTSWIDMFPFPKFRDNLIKRGVESVPEDMCRDLFGDMFSDRVAPISCDNDISLLSTLPSPAANSGAGNREFGDPDDYTAGRRCLITWGEPWNVESWEVTPGFLKNWRWALEGCDDLIQASNRWRALRNEELLLPL